MPKVKRLFNIVKSKRAALITIGLLTLFSVVGMIVPQAELNNASYQTWAQQHGAMAAFVERLGLHRVFSSWWFIATALVFTLNLLFCTVSQVAVAMRKRQVGSWGKTVFHIGLLILVIGGFISNGLKMSGYIMLAEGESCREEHAGYTDITEGALFNEGMHQGFQITLLKQNPVFDKQGNLDYTSSQVALTDDKGNNLVTHWVERGSPLIYKNYRFFHYRVGFAPQIVIKDSQGKVLFQTYLLLNTNSDEGGKKETYAVSDQDLPGTSYKVNLQFVPNGKDADGELTQVSDTLANPMIKVEIFDSGTGQKIVGGIITKSEVVNLDSGKSFQFGPEIKRWVGLEVVNDPGAGVLFVGAAVALIGIIMFFSTFITFNLKTKEA